MINPRKSSPGSTVPLSLYIALYHLSGYCFSFWLTLYFHIIKGQKAHLILFVVTEMKILINCIIAPIKIRTHLPVLCCDYKFAICYIVSFVYAAFLIRLIEKCIYTFSILHDMKHNAMTVLVLQYIFRREHPEIIIDLHSIEQCGDIHFCLMAS